VSLDKGQTFLVIVWQLKCIFLLSINLVIFTKEFAIEEALHSLHREKPKQLGTVKLCAMFVWNLFDKAEQCHVSSNSTETSNHLMDLSVVPANAVLQGRIHPATMTFAALRL